MYYVNIVNWTGKTRGKRVTRNISFALPTVQAAVKFAEKRGCPVVAGLITNWPKCPIVKRVEQI